MSSTEFHLGITLCWDVKPKCRDKISRKKRQIAQIQNEGRDLSKHKTVVSTARNAIVLWLAKTVAMTSLSSSRSWIYTHTHLTSKHDPTRESPSYPVSLVSFPHPTPIPVPQSSKAHAHEQRARISMKDGGRRLVRCQRNLLVLKTTEPQQ